jgi:putative ABC transport system permease protein
MYALRILKSQPLRLMLTIGGIALCIMLILFLLSIYRGVSDGSVEYIRQNKADLWVLQKNATNILRGSSLLSTGHGGVIREVNGVKSISAVLFLLSSVRKNDRVATVFLTGFEPEKGLGGPPQIIEGHSVRNDDEIVLDKSFAKKLDFKVNDRITIQEDTLTVVGISEGTNAFVIQYAFVTLHHAQTLIGFPNLVTTYLITKNDSISISNVIEGIQKELPGVEVIDHQTFLNNNIHEMESGFLPLLYTIAVIGAIVLTAILSLLLSINILERKKDFAVMKTIGSSSNFLWQLVIEQSLLICVFASVIAVIFFFPMVLLVENLSPEVSTKTNIVQILMVILIVIIMSLLSSLISIQRLRKIYPLEAFQ